MAEDLARTLVKLLFPEEGWPEQDRKVELVQPYLDDLCEKCQIVKDLGEEIDKLNEDVTQLENDLSGARQYAGLE